MSSDDTHYSDSSTGLKVEILLGQGNYTRWARDLKLAAEGKDVWTLITPSSIAEEDREEILTKPRRPTKPDLSAAKYTTIGTRGATSDGETAAKQEIFRTDNNNYQLDITEYKLNVEAFKEQQERIRDARTLLLSTVTPTIRDSVSTKVIPSELMTAIKDLCKMSDSQALAFCYQKLDNIKYGDFTSISTFINTVTTHQQEIHSLSGTYGDEQVISKVIGLLPEPYNDFKRYWNMLSGSPSLPRDLHTLHTHLLGEETRLESEGKLKKDKKKGKRDEKGKDKDKDGGELHECKHCHKMVKHKEKNCWDNPDNKDKKPIKSEGY